MRDILFGKNLNDLGNFFSSDVIPLLLDRGYSRKILFSANSIYGTVISKIITDYLVLDKLEVNIDLSAFESTHNLFLETRNPFLFIENLHYNVSTNKFFNINFIDVCIQFINNDPMRVSFSLGKDYLRLLETRELELDYIGFTQCIYYWLGSSSAFANTWDIEFINKIILTSQKEYNFYFNWNYVLAIYLSEKIYNTYISECDYDTTVYDFCKTEYVRIIKNFSNFGCEEIASYLDLNKIMQYVEIQGYDLNILYYADDYKDQVVRLLFDKTNKHLSKNILKLNSYSVIIGYLFKPYNKELRESLKNQNIDKWLKIKVTHLKLKFGFNIRYFFNLIISNYLLGVMYLKHHYYTIEELNKILSEHNIVNYLVNTSSSFNELMRRYEILKEVFYNEFIRTGEYPIYLYGVLENSLYNKNVSFREELKTLIKEFRKENLIPLVEPLPLREKILGIEIVELYTKSSLIEEGKYNKHCVGGYYKYISETHRIFSLRNKEVRYTVEFKYLSDNLLDYRDIFGKSRKNEWSCTQCQSYDNIKREKLFFCNMDSEDPLYKKIKLVILQLKKLLDDIYNPYKKRLSQTLGDEI